MEYSKQKPSGEATSSSEAVDRRRELDLREREVVAKEKKLNQSRWSSPLVIGLFAAALGLGGNVWVEHANNKWLKDTEESKTRSNLMLEAIRTGDDSKACQNLRFFLDAGLLDKTEVQAVMNDCASAPKGPPSLPSEK